MISPFTLLVTYVVGLVVVVFATMVMSFVKEGELDGDYMFGGVMGGFTWPIVLVAVVIGAPFYYGSRGLARLIVRVTRNRRRLR